MSRLGHFTCPVAAGAVFLAQHPTLPTTSSGGSGSSSDSSSAESAQVQAVLRVKQDPLVAALDDMTSFDQVQQVGADDWHISSWVSMICLHSLLTFNCAATQPSVVQPVYIAFLCLQRW